MNNPIIPVDYFTVSAGQVVTGFNAYGRQMKGELKACADFGYYIQDCERILFDVIYVRNESI